LCSSMKAVISCVGGRAPPRRKPGQKDLVGPPQLPDSRSESRMRWRSSVVSPGLPPGQARPAAPRASGFPGHRGLLGYRADRRRPLLVLVLVLNMSRTARSRISRGTCERFVWAPSFEAREPPHFPGRVSLGTLTQYARENGTINIKGEANAGAQGWDARGMAGRAG
jgi:hypothetical protein